MRRPLSCAVASAFAVSTSLAGTAQAGDFLRDAAPAIGIIGGLTALCAMTKCLGGRGPAVHQRHTPANAPSAERRQVREQGPVKPSESAAKSPEPAPPAEGATAPYQQPTFLPHRAEEAPSPPPHRESLPEPPAPGPTPPHIPPSSPFDPELAIFNEKVTESGAPPIRRERLTAALKAAFSSTTGAAALERLPSDEGWTQDILEAHILRRAETLLPEFAAGLNAGGTANDDTVKQLIARSADAALPSALTEQEAVAFSSSLARFMKANAGEGGQPDTEGLPKEVTDVFVEVDDAVARTDLGLRGKLRGRRIVLDCVAQSKLNGSAGAHAPAPNISDGSDPQCGSRAIAQISGPGQFGPAPAQAVWTQDGPMLNGQKWALAGQ
jgi:hypothetical protein